MQIVRKDERRITTSGAAKLKVEHLRLHPECTHVDRRVPSRCHDWGCPHAHEGQEVHVVIKGTIYAQQGEDGLNLLRVIPLAGMPAPPFRQKYGRGHRDCANLHLH